MLEDTRALTRRYKVVLTITATTAVAITAMILGQHELASAAGGALFGYLGKMNGYTDDEQNQ